MQRYKSVDYQLETQGPELLTLHENRDTYHKRGVTTTYAYDLR
jgi:hypothetical protein